MDLKSFHMPRNASIMRKLDKDVPSTKGRLVTQRNRALIRNFSSFLDD
jgi:hypothetical protein